MSESLNLLAAVYPDTEHADVTLDTLHKMHQAANINLHDAVKITKDDDGKIHIHETKELTTRKGARRGAIIAGIFGVIYPPSLIATVLAGGGIGALIGKMRDTGIKTDKLKELADGLAPGKAALAVITDNESVVAVQQTLAGYEGTLVTELIDEETLKHLYLEENKPE